MKATLIHNTGRQRYYRLSEPITRGRTDLGGDLDITEDVNKILPRLQLTEDDRNTIREAYANGCTMVCISDARTHVERLAFPAVELRGEYGILPGDIAGKHTMMIHGGDPKAVYDDVVYLRYLCLLNGLEWEGIE